MTDYLAREMNMFYEIVIDFVVGTGIELGETRIINIKNN